MEENKNSASSFIKGFLLGGLIGAGLSVLYAPKSGKEMREDIKKKTSEFKDEADRTFSDAKALANKIIADGLKKAEDLHHQAEEKLREAHKLAAKLIEDSKDTIESVTSSAKEKLQDSKETITKATEKKTEATEKGKKGKTA